MVTRLILYDLIVASSESGAQLSNQQSQKLSKWMQEIVTGKDFGKAQSVTGKGQVKIWIMRQANP